MFQVFIIHKYFLYLINIELIFFLPTPQLEPSCIPFTFNSFLKALEMNERHARGRASRILVREGFHKRIKGGGNAFTNWALGCKPFCPVIQRRTTEPETRYGWPLTRRGPIPYTYCPFGFFPNHAAVWWREEFFCVFRLCLDWMKTRRNAFGRVKMECEKHFPVWLHS